MGDSQRESGRLLVCTSCGEEVEVFELPHRFTDPALYVCIPCLDPRHIDPPQLELVKPRRSETRTYEPSQAQIPY